MCSLIWYAPQCNCSLRICILFLLSICSFRSVPSSILIIVFFHWNDSFLFFIFLQTWFFLFPSCFFFSVSPILYFLFNSAYFILSFSYFFSLFIHTRLHHFFLSVLAALAPRTFHFSVSIPNVSWSHFTTALW